MEAAEVRAFVAFDVDAESVARFAALSERLRGAMPKGMRAGFVAPEKMHVTMKFLGAMREELVPTLSEAIRAVAAGPAPITRAMRLGAFGSPKRAHVIVVELDDASGELARIAAAIDARAAALGFAREARTFRPHLTLARLRQTTDARRVLADTGAVPAEEVRVAQLALYRSDPSPHGSVYTPLARAAFSAE